MKGEISLMSYQVINTSFGPIFIFLENDKTEKITYHHSMFTADYQQLIIDKRSERHYSSTIRRQ